MKRLILRGAYMVDGTGAPAQGPVDIVVVQDRIAEIPVVGAPKLAVDLEKRLTGARFYRLVGGNKIRSLRDAQRDTLNRDPVDSPQRPSKVL